MKEIKIKKISDLKIGDKILVEIEGQGRVGKVTAFEERYKGTGLEVVVEYPFRFSNKDLEKISLLKPQKKQKQELDIAGIYTTNAKTITG